MATLINSLPHIYDHIFSTQGSQCSLSKNKSVVIFLHHTQEGFTFMDPVSFQRAFSTSKFLLVLLLASPLHICSLCALSFFCCYFSALTGPLSLHLDSLISPSWGFSLFQLPKHLMGGYKLSISYQMDQICVELYRQFHNSGCLESQETQHCRLPSGCHHEQPPQNWSLSKSQMASGRDVVQGWEVESVISKVTFAAELIIVKLLSSPWPREAHLL